MRAVRGRIIELVCQILDIQLNAHCVRDIVVSGRIDAGISGQCRVRTRIANIKIGDEGLILIGSAKTKAELVGYLISAPDRERVLWQLTRNFSAIIGFTIEIAIPSCNKELLCHIALQLQCGSVFVNAQVKSDVRLPFGGCKQSGFGREMAQLGIREFTNAKTLVID